MKACHLATKATSGLFKNEMAKGLRSIRQLQNGEYTKRYPLIKVSDLARLNGLFKHGLFLYRLDGRNRETMLETGAFAPNDETLYIRGGHTRGAVCWSVSPEAAMRMSFRVGSKEHYPTLYSAYLPPDSEIPIVAIAGVLRVVATPFVPLFAQMLLSSRSVVDTGDLSVYEEPRILDEAEIVVNNLSWQNRFSFEEIMSGQETVARRQFRDLVFKEGKAILGVGKDITEAPDEQYCPVLEFNEDEQVVGALAAFVKQRTVSSCPERVNTHSRL